MTKILILIVLFLFLNGCSADTKSGIWDGKKEEKKILKNEEILFKKTNSFKKELNTNIKVNIDVNYSSLDFINNSNNNGILNYDGNLEEIDTVKFSKIENFSLLKPELLITKKNEIFFFDGKGNIFKMNENFNVKWKQNIYSKKEKKLKPMVNFASQNNQLIITDNLSKYYSINIDNGEIIWNKKNSSAFNSQIKVVNEKFITIDFDNTIRCFSVKNGDEIWNYKSENTFIKSPKKLSLVIYKDKVIFLNTNGDLNALNLKNGNLIWQTPTQSNASIADSFSLIFSDIVLNKNRLFFSNNKSEFFSINADNGSVLWLQKIKSSLRPSIIDKLIITISDEGFLILINSENGQIIRSTNIKELIKGFDDKNFQNTGFVVAKNKIYLSNTLGTLLIIDLIDGKPKIVKKIHGDSISRPYIHDKSMFLLTKNSIKKFN